MKEIQVIILSLLATVYSMGQSCNGFNYPINSENSVVYRFDIIYSLDDGARPLYSSLPTLDSIAVFLGGLDSMKIEICTHTDYKGDYEYNTALTSLRAKRVRDYLVHKGVNGSQLVISGYGESVPVTVDSCMNRQNPSFDIGQVLDAEYIEKLDSDSLVEQACRLNRRTEFKIINRP